MAQLRYLQWLWPFVLWTLAESHGAVLSRPSRSVLSRKFHDFLLKVRSTSRGHGRSMPLDQEAPDGCSLGDCIRLGKYFCQLPSVAYLNSTLPGSFRAMPASERT